MTSRTRQLSGLWLAALLCFTACENAESIPFDAGCQEPVAVDAEEATALYVEAWSEEDPLARACLVERSLAPNAVLIAGTAPTEGHSAVARELEQRMSWLLDEGIARDSAGPTASRHDEARLPWLTTTPSGAVTERGEDWLEFDEDGLLLRIHMLQGTGTTAPLSPQLLAWQRAWNSGAEASRADALDAAVTENVHFTDLLADVRGRDALGVEIGRQQDAFNAQLRLDNSVEVFASRDGEPALIRLKAELLMPQGDPIGVTDYVRLRDGQVERLSGFPRAAP